MRNSPGSAAGLITATQLAALTPRGRASEVPRPFGMISRTGRGACLNRGRPASALSGAWHPRGRPPAPRLLRRRVLLVGWQPGVL